MQGYADNFIPVIPTDHAPLHTPTHPFCLDTACPCKEDQELIETVGLHVQDGLLTPKEADQLVQGKTL